MKQFTLIFILFPLFVIAQKDSISFGVYSWKEPVSKSTYGSAAVLFEGNTNTMEWMQMSANTILLSKNKNIQNVPVNEERLIIIKSGMMGVTILDSSYSIGAGSIVLLMPGETFSYQNANVIPCSYYILKYRSKLPAADESEKSTGGSLVKDWNKIEFKPTDKGGRRSFFERRTAMCKRLEIHVTTLKEGLQSHAPHTHKAAEFTLVTEGNTEMQIGGQVYKGNEGSVYYAASNVLHALQNTGTGNCTYFAIQFE